MRRNLTAAVLTAILGWALVPAAASASTMGFNGVRYSFTGGPGQDNILRIEYFPGSGEIRFDDSFQIFDDGTLPATCDYVSGDVTYVKCPSAPNPRVDASDGNDVVQGDISADGGPEEILGGTGNDVVKGGHGDDLIDGGPGDDRFEEDPAVGAGNDLLSGGDGFDTTLYSCTLGCTDPVTVRLDGAANDGPAGRADNVQTERVDGADGADLLVGGPGPEQLFGNGGDDEVHGGGGNDLVDGVLGNDRIFGEDGDDVVRDSSSTNDLLDGGAGSDEITADGPCFFIGCDPGGNDQILAQDGTRDVISCLGGADTATVDGVDTLLADRGGCETVHGLPGPVCCSPVPRTFTFTAASRLRFAVLRRLGLLVVVRCTAPCSIDAGLFVNSNLARLVRVGRARRTLRAAGTARLRVKLTRRAKRRLARHRRFTLTLRVKVIQGGRATTRSKRVTVRR
jgi:RTX calcium-binding nonapeptide repeat (4 copies)